MDWQVAPLGQPPLPPPPPPPSSLRPVEGVQTRAQLVGWELPPVVRMHWPLAVEPAGAAGQEPEVQVGEQKSPERP